MVGQALWSGKSLCPRSWDNDYFINQLSVNRKSNGPFFLKLIPGESPANDASFRIWSHFHNDPVDSATVTSLPTVSQTAVLLPRGVNGNTQVVPVLQEVADMSSPRFLVSGRCWPATGSQICVPNKSPQCSNSTGKFEWNFVPVFTIWFPTFWELSSPQWRRVSKRHINSNSKKKW